MNHQFKPGDLALVIDARIEANIGKVVTLVAFTDEAVIRLPVGGLTDNPNRIKCWLIHSVDLINSSSLNETPRPVSYGAIPERNLMPLRGDFTPEREKASEVPA